MMNPTTISPESSSASANHLGLSAKGKKGKSGAKEGLFSRLLVKLQQTANQEGTPSKGTATTTASKSKLTPSNAQAAPLVAKVKTSAHLVAPKNSPQTAQVNSDKNSASKAEKAAGTHVKLAQTVLSHAVNGIKEPQTELKATQIANADKKSHLLIETVASEQHKSSEASKEVIASVQEAAFIKPASLVKTKDRETLALDATTTNPNNKKNVPVRSSADNQQSSLATKLSLSDTDKTAKFANIFANNQEKGKNTTQAVQAEVKSVVKSSATEVKGAAQSSANEVKSTAQPSANEVRSTAQPSANEVKSTAQPSANEVKSIAQSSANEVKSIAQSSANEVKSIAQSSPNEVKSTAQSSVNEVKSAAQSSANELKASTSPQEQAATHNLQTNRNKDTDFEKTQVISRTEKSGTSDAAQSDSLKSQQSPIATLQQRSPNQAANQHITANIAQESNTQLNNKVAESSSASSGQDFASNQDGTDQMFLDSNKNDVRSSKGLDFQAQLAYKSQRSFTPGDAMLEIIRSAKDGSTSLELQLEPANLGKVVVNVQLDAAKQLQVSFTVEHAASRHALEQQMPQLRLALAQQGLDLGSFNMQMNQQQQGNQQQGSGSAHRSETELDNIASTLSSDESNQTRIGVNLATDGHLSILA